MKKSTNFFAFVSLRSVKQLFSIMILNYFMFGFTYAAKGQMHKNMHDTSLHHLNVKFKDMRWGKIVPELGERSSEITILRVDPKTQATQLLIRVPKNFHVPMHWHTANETHTIISGTFIMECDGKRDTLNTGSFNYTPATMQHQAWTTNKEGALLFITVDKAWDINWVGEPPKPEDFIIK